MSRRLSRSGTVLDVSAQACQISVTGSGACSRCGAGCLMGGLAPASRSVVIANHLLSGKSGKIGDQVRIDVSSRGLTLLAAILFGPVILVMVAAVMMSAAGVSPAAMAGTVLPGMALALAVSTGWTRRVAHKCLALKAHS